MNPPSVCDLANEHGNEEDPAYDTGTDIVELLDDEEARQFEEQKFDPKLKSDTSWKPPDLMLKFLEKHFNQNLKQEERAAILEDFPKPECSVL